MNRIAVALLVGAVALSPGLALAGEGDESLEKIVVETAHTMGEHEALARYYRAKAEDALAEGRRHEAMGRSYTQGKLPQRQLMKRHCRNLSQKQTEIAVEYQELAKLHEEEAKKAN